MQASERTLDKSVSLQFLSLSWTLIIMSNVRKLNHTYWVSSGREKSETLCILCLHSSEAGHAGVEGGGVDCGHGAAILHTRRAVVEGGDSVGSARVAEKGNHLSSKD